MVSISSHVNQSINQSKLFVTRAMSCKLESEACTGAKSVVRTIYGNSNGFEVKVGMHQG